MNELKIIAIIDVLAEHKHEVLTAFYQVVDQTRKEEGNISYELHQDTKNPQRFVIIEIWESQEAIESHNASEHFQSFIQFVEGKTTSLTVDVIKKIY